jgi:hypothetical protein
MNGCGCADCCSGLSESTPVEIVNRPGLTSIAYRSGTWATFRASMHAGFTRASRPALARLRIRNDDDPAIAVIDAWAGAADVLTFYTERIAQEHYLRTATERRSVADLVALLGYRLAPGVAAQTWLAITLETAPGAPHSATIPARTRVATLPGPGEVPQTFETTEDLAAVGAWNRPQLLRTEPRTPRNDDTEVVVSGTATGLKRGDRLLFVGDDHTVTEGFELTRVTAVSPEPPTGTTTVSFSPPLSALPLVDGRAVAVHLLQSQSALFGFNAPNPLLFTEDVRQGLETAGLVDPTTHDWTFAEITSEVLLDGLYDGVEPTTLALLIVDGALSLFDITSVRETAASAYGVSGRVTALTLGAAEGDLDDAGGPATRSTIVQFRSRQLPLGDVPVVAPLTGSAIPLATPLPPQTADRRILVRGRRTRALIPKPPVIVPTLGASVVQRSLQSVFWLPKMSVVVLSVEEAAELPGQLRWTVRSDDGEEFTVVGTPGTVLYQQSRDSDEIVGEVATVAGSSSVDPVGALVLRAPLVNVYDLQGATPLDMFGNVANATHGESVLGEVLGSADAGRPFQRFALRRKPLTFVPAQTLTGGASTLEVRVNDVLWHETTTLYSAGPRDRVYVTQIADDATTTVIFGDAVTGAATPTGTDNVTASYRAGVGVAGNARAEQVTLPTSKPLGLKSVTNPLAATGGQDPQAMADARVNAPRSVLTLGRVVSLQDYADFAASYAGVAKADATWTWDGSRRGVLVTVASVGGGRVPTSSTLLTSLRSSLLAAGNNRIALVVEDFTPATFAVQALLRVDPDHDATAVQDAVAAALLTGYAFDAREFGQAVSLSEVTAVVHGVDGVVGVRIDRLYRTGEAVALNTVLPALAPLPGGPPDAPPAEILTLDAEGLDLGVGW